MSSPSNKISSNVYSFRTQQEQYSAKPANAISAKELANDPSCRYVKILDAETRSLPQYPLKPEKRWESVCFPESFVLKLPKGRVFSRDGVVITKDHQVLSDSIQPWVSAEERSLHKVTTMPAIKKVNLKLAVIAAHASACYYHWMTDILPRIKLLQDSGIQYDKVYIPSLWGNFPFQKYTLAKLGLEPEKWIEGNQDTYIEAEEIIFPSLAIQTCCTQPSWICDFLQKTFCSEEDLEAEGEKKLFISRKVVTSSSKRMIINEEEVLAFLTPLGFEKVLLEDLTVGEQASIFSKAKVIIAAHGAGLTNLVFCKPKTRIIEIFNPNHLDETYFFMSKLLGLDHRCLQPSTDRLSEQQKNNCDIYLPVNELSKSLHEE